MNWYRENRWLASFLGGFGITLLLAIWFVLRAKADFADASTEFNGVAAERERLEQLNPFPDDANFINTQRVLQNYVTTLSKVKSELKSQVVPLTPLLPNEFQTRLRDAIVNTTEAARINRVQLSENFHLGFDEFTAVLPETAASPVLGQQLNQVELLVNILIDSHVDALTDLMRSAVPAKPLKAPPPPARTPATEPSKVIERSVVELAFIASP